MQHFAAIDRARSKAVKSRFLHVISWKLTPARWWQREHIAGHVARPGSTSCYRRIGKPPGFRATRSWS